MRCQTLFCRTHKWKLFAVILFAMIIGSCASGQSVKDDVSSEEGAGFQTQITNIMASEDDSAYYVLVQGNQQLTYTSVKQNFPLGVLFYFPETMIDSDFSIQPDNDLIEVVEATQLADTEAGTRVLIALTRDIPYDVTPEGDGIQIAFPKPSAPETTETLADSATEPEVETAAPAAAATATVAPEQPPAVPASALESIFITKSENQIKISIKADGIIENYNAFTIDKPARIVFDLNNLKSPYKKQQVIDVNTVWVKRVRHFAHPDKIRVVLDTKPAHLKAFSAVPTRDGLDIFVGTEVPPEAALTEETPAGATAPAAALVETERTQPISAAPMPPASDDRLAWVNRVDFRKETAGKSTVIIGTTQPVSYDLDKPSPRLLQLKLINTRLPKYRMRPLITTRFESAVDRVTPFVKSSQKDTTFITIELREDVAHTVSQQDDRLMIQFEASSIPPKPLEQANLPSWKQVLARTEPTEQPDTLKAAETPAPQSAAAAGVAAVQATDMAPAQAPPSETPAPSPALAQPTPVQPATPSGGPYLNQMEALGQPSIFQRKYTGEKIALDFYETDIKNVFRILREISGKNFAIDKDVKGTVTLTLEKPVPWDQVLDLVLKMNRLGISYEGDIIRIATLATLTAEEKARQDRIAAQQKSKQVVKALEPMVTEYIAVNYSDAKGEILPHVKGLVTANRGSISVDNRNNQLIVTDVPAKIRQIRTVVDRIDTVTPQVIIEAKVVEVNDEFSLQLGIDWNLLWGPQDLFGIDGSEIIADVAMNFPSEASSNVGFSFSKLTGTPLIIDAALNAAEANSQGKIISAPKIVTLDNKKAKIKQGVEFPYLERDSSGNATVKFKNIDLLLEVTPTVTPDDRVLMKIFITKNDIGTITEGVPSLNTNEAQTELLVNDGDTIVIGGIIKSNIQDATSGWPGLKDIPLLGWLFKTNNKTESANELLIFITPRIVQLEQRRLS